FAEFYRGARDRVARALALTLGDVHLGAEAATRPWPGLPAVGPDRRLRRPAAWVYRAGLNWATSVLRRRRRAPSAPADGPPADFGPIAEPTVTAALATLAPAQRSVIVCRHYLGLSEAETAAALGTRPRHRQEPPVPRPPGTPGRLAHLRPDGHR
ncbi:MAG: sigma factor-like helix-turn-helix DNA-binding protein, partial [Acidimicrobiales bacterium]